MQLNILTICVVLSQVIIGSSSIENIRQSSELLVRNKRVLDFRPGGDVPAQFVDFQYVVNIKLNNKTHCVGSILSIFTVITSAFCASEPISKYTIVHGTIYTYRGTARYVVEKKIRLGNYAAGARASDGIALFIVNTPFTPQYARTISLHVGPLLPGLHATVAGWGCYYLPGIRGTQIPRSLRSITAVPIMSHRECVRAYQGIYDITDEDLCIYDEHKHCGHTDFGAPLVIDGQLAGVYLRRSPVPLHGDPQIFVILQHLHYSQWIRDNIVHPRGH